MECRSSWRRPPCGDVERGSTGNATASDKPARAAAGVEEEKKRVARANQESQGQRLNLQSDGRRADRIGRVES